mmetsp:Transcript_5117/g.16583  ORF Transcript_5117/g.16583 Transcript_5117/m.16583 type:complete len:243 (+) Transcript_5117:1364-2092(+)
MDHAEDLVLPMLFPLLVLEEGPTAPEGAFEAALDALHIEARHETCFWLPGALLHHLDTVFHLLEDGKDLVAVLQSAAGALAADCALTLGRQVEQIPHLLLKLLARSREPLVSGGTDSSHILASSPVDEVGDLIRLLRGVCKRMPVGTLADVLKGHEPVNQAGQLVAKPVGVVADGHVRELQRVLRTSAQLPGEELLDSLLERHLVRLVGVEAAQRDGVPAHGPELEPEPASKGLLPARKGDE